MGRSTRCRVNIRGVFVLEVAARPIGGLCAKALRFTQPSRVRPSGRREHQLRSSCCATPWRVASGWRPRRLLGGDMITIRAAVYMPRRGVERGQSRGGRDPNHRKADQHCGARGASYLGFIFARAAEAADAERAVREAHARLRFTIDPLIAVTTA